MNEQGFKEFIDICYKELEEKQKKLFSDFGLGKSKKYWWDQTSKTIQFKNDELVELEFEVVFIGTWAHQRNTWMWCWANESFTDETRKDSEVLKGLKDKTEYEIFENPVFDCKEIMAYELTAISIDYLNALGMYRAPGEKNHLFMALIKNIIKDGKRVD